MANYAVDPSRILPISSNDSSGKYPQAAIQSITMGIRIGDDQYAIGYIHQFQFEQKRENKTIWQIEPYPDVLGDSEVNPSGGTASGTNKTFNSQVFDSGTTYWPGEAVEVIPGKMGAIEITLNRYMLYTSNIMAAVLRASASGVYNAAAVSPNIDPATSTTNAIQYVSILQQVRPFDIYQIFISPQDGSLLWGRKFGGCWFSSWGEKTPESDKNEPILEEGKVVAKYIRPLGKAA